MSETMIDDDYNTTDRHKSSSFRACQICRQRKVKCVAVPGNESTCEYCYAHGVQCQAVRPALKRKRLNTAAELRARVEQLESKLSITLREQSARTGWTQSSVDHSHVPPSNLPQQISRFGDNSIPAMGTIPAHIEKKNQHNQTQTQLPGRFDQQAPLRSDTFSPLQQSSFDMTDQSIGSLRYGSGRFLDISQTSVPQNLPLPLPSLNNRSDNTTSNFTTWGPRSNFSTVAPQCHEHRDSHEAQSQSCQTAPLTSGQIETLPCVSSSIRESVEGNSRPADSLADDGSDDPDFVNSVSHHTRILGPIAPFDADFYELCITRGLATTDDRDCDAKDKLWARFYKLSSDPTLPLYKFHFRNGVTPADLRCNVPPEAVAQLDFWTDNYGDTLLKTFTKKMAPRIRIWSVSELRGSWKESLKKKSTSYICAIYALAATCVDSWSIKKRAYLGLSFYRCAMTYLQRALYPGSLEAVQTLVLLAAFPFQSDSSLLNSWALALAFEMKLNIDPEHWQILEEEKNLRRRLFWLVIVSHRWSAFKHLYPSVSNDAYDTIVPTMDESSDQTFSYEVQVSEIVATIAQSFYSVRGAKMVHHNVEGSMVVARHLEAQVIAVQNSLCQEHPSTRALSPVSFTMLRLNLGIAALMVHRPFLDNKSLNIMDALEHHQKAAQTALDCVTILQNMPDAYFTEAWPTHSILMLALITFTLLREHTLSKDENLRVRCREGLINFMSVTNQQASRWYLSRFGSMIISVAKALTGEDYGETTAAAVPYEYADESTPPMLNSSIPLVDNIDFATFEWEHFSQLLGLDSSSLLADWTQA